MIFSVTSPKRPPVLTMTSTEIAMTSPAWEFQVIPTKQPFSSWEFQLEFRRFQRREFPPREFRGYNRHTAPTTQSPRPLGFPAGKIKITQNQEIRTQFSDQDRPGILQEIRENSGNRPGNGLNPPFVEVRCK